jgi:hypothetical protein
MTDPAEITDETLMALADGELSEIDRVKIEAAVNASETLQVRYQVFARSRDALREDLQDRRIEPQGEKLKSLTRDIEIAAVDKIVSFDRRKKHSLLSFQSITSIAATLVVGVALGLYADKFATAPPLNQSETYMTLSFPGSATEKRLTSNSQSLAETLRVLGKQPGSAIFKTLRNSLDSTGVLAINISDEQRLLVRSDDTTKCIEVALERGTAIIDQAKFCPDENGIIIFELDKNDE